MQNWGTLEYLHMQYVDTFIFLAKKKNIASQLCQTNISFVTLLFLFGLTDTFLHYFAHGSMLECSASGCMLFKETHTVSLAIHWVQREREVYYKFEVWDTVFMWL